jgi:hypothetical protein
VTGYCKFEHVKTTQKYFSCHVASCCVVSHNVNRPLQRKMEKTNHLHHRVTQYPARLWCIRNICCGAFDHEKKKKIRLFEDLYTREFRFSQRCSGRFKSYRMLCCVVDIKQHRVISHTTCNLHFRTVATRSCTPSSGAVIAKY